MIREPVRLQDAYRFFLPLILMTELNMISKSVIHAFLARTDNPSVVLAGFNVSFTFYYTLTSATEVTTLMAISYLQDRASARRIVVFFTLLLSVPLGVVLLVAFTALGDWLYGSVFGASPGAVVEAKRVSIVLCFSAPVLILRGMAFALLMLHRRTLFITSSTLVRVFALAVSLLVWPHFLDGAAIGAAALVTCMTVETGFAWFFAWRHFRDLLPRRGERPELGELWRFAWPLMLNQSAEMGVVLTINVFLGRLANADLALAAFGVVHGLVGLLMSPMRNLAQTAQTLAITRDDARVLVRFTLQLVAGFVVLAVVLFWTPLRAWVLDDVMGLAGEMSAYCAPAVRIAFAMALFWAFSALLRGLFAGAKATRVLALTGGVRVAGAALVGVLALAFPGVNGAVLGLAAWILAYALEAGILGVRYRQRGAISV